MATLGIDLAVAHASHVATLADEQGHVVWSRHRFRNRREELVALVARVGDVDGLTVVMEPTRNAWVPVAAYFRAVGAKVVLIAPEQSADLRRYYKKHTKNDRLDSVLLSRVPLLHPEGLKPLSDLGPADTLKRAVRRRSRFVASRLAAKQRIDAMLDLLGPAYSEVFGTRCNKTTLAVLERYADPITLRRLGLARLTAFVKRTSHGHWNASHAAEILAAADAAIALWADGGLDFRELAWDLASEIRTVRNIDTEIDRLEERIAELYTVADPKRIAASAPGVGATLAAGIVGRLGDVTRFENLAGVRSFSGIVPQVAQSGQHQTRPGITKQGDPGLRRDLWFAANVARDPRSPTCREVLPARRRSSAASQLGDLPHRHDAPDTRRDVSTQQHALRRARHRWTRTRSCRSRGHHRRPLHRPRRGPPTFPRTQRSERVDRTGVDETPLQVDSLNPNYTLDTA